MMDCKPPVVEYSRMIPQPSRIPAFGGMPRITLNTIPIAPIWAPTTPAQHRKEKKPVSTWAARP